MTIERYRRSTRRYLAAVYATTLLLLATGWWLAGREGTPSPLALVTGVPDVELHVWFGWALLLVAVLPLPFALRGVPTFVRETIRVDPGDRAWLVRWPIAIATGRFPRHEGHFDPGQRLANIAIAARVRRVARGRLPRDPGRQGRVGDGAGVRRPASTVRAVPPRPRSTGPHPSGTRSARHSA